MILGLALRLRGLSSKVVRTYKEIRLVEETLMEIMRTDLILIGFTTEGYTVENSISASRPEGMTSLDRQQILIHSNSLSVMELHDRSRKPSLRIEPVPCLQQ